MAIIQISLIELWILHHSFCWLFYKKKSQFKVGLYDIKYNYSADYDLFLRMIKKYKLKGISTKKMKFLEGLDQAVYPQE